MAREIRAEADIGSWTSALPRDAVTFYFTDAPDGQSADELKRRLLRREIGGALLPAEVFVRQSALFAAASIPFFATTGAEREALLSALVPLLAARLMEMDLDLRAVVARPPVWLSVAKSRADAGRIEGATLAVDPGVLEAAALRFRELIGARLVAPSGDAEFRLGRGKDGQASAVAMIPIAILVVRRGAAGAAMRRVPVTALADSGRQPGSQAALPASLETRFKAAGDHMAAEWAPGAGTDGVAIRDAVRRAK